MILFATATGRRSTAVLGGLPAEPMSAPDQGSGISIVPEMTKIAMATGVPGIPGVLGGLLIIAPLPRPALTETLLAITTPAVRDLPIIGSAMTMMFIGSTPAELV